MRTTLIPLALAGIVLFPPAVSGEEMLVLHLDEDGTSLEFVLDATMHTVTGRLGSASGRIAFEPSSGLATGRVVIDLTGASSGVAKRDRKMHEKVLETDRFPRAVYRVDQIDLPGELRQGKNEVQLHGDLDFHGSTHRVSVPATVTLDGDRVQAVGWLEVPYVEWGVTDPSFFVLRVAKTVRVEIALAGLLDGEVRGTPE